MSIIQNLFSSVSQVLLSAQTWVIFAVAFIALYAANQKKRQPTHLEIGDIVEDYKNVFINKWDSTYIIVVPLFFSMATILSCPLDNEMSNLLCIIVSILAAAVINFMAMTSDCTDKILKKETISQGESRRLTECKESLSIGLLEILIAVVLLILIFLAPVFENSQLQFFFGAAIYFLFYVLLLNVFIMMRRLRQIYKEQE